MTFNFGLFPDTTAKAHGSSKITKQCKEIMEEYFKQINRVMVNPRQNYGNTDFEIDELEEVNDPTSVNHAVAIYVSVYSLKNSNNPRRTRIGHSIYYFPMKYLDNPKMAVYLKLKDNFSKKMKALNTKIKEVDILLEQWHDNYKEFKKLEDEIFGGENE